MSSKSLSSLCLLPLAAAITFLAGCAGSPAPKAGAPTTADALYAQLDQASKGYETAIEQSRQGDTTGSSRTLDASMNALKDIAARCAPASGCDPQRVLSVYDRLLRLKDGNFIAGEEDDTIAQAPDTQTSPGTSPISTAIPQVQRSVTMLRGQKLSDLVAMNGPVKAALEMWLTQWRPQLMDAYVNYQYLRAQMWPEYQKAGLPEAVLFGILAKESGGKVHAVSRSGASGPLQFMYATGIRFGLSSADGFDQRFDPQLSARANAAYLDEQLAQFNNNLELTLGAYNAGEGRMRRLAQQYPGADFYDPQIYNQLSPETREYVPMVLAAAWLFLHPDSYHLNFPKVDGVPGSITLQRPASISELTVCLGGAGGMNEGWFRTLRNLNPRLDPQVSQPTGSRLVVPVVLEKAYAASCTSGPWPILANDLHTAVKPVVIEPPAAAPVAASRPKGTRSYKVRRGDTLAGIVRKLDCTNVEEVAKMNGISGHHLSPGQTLRLPTCR